MDGPCSSMQVHVQGKFGEVQQQMVGCKKRQALEFGGDHSAKQLRSGTPGYKNGQCCSVRPLGQTAILARCNH